jgi:hypothetical protein
MLNELRTNALRGFLCALEPTKSVSPAMLVENRPRRTGLDFKLYIIDTKRDHKKPSELLTRYAIDSSQCFQSYLWS